MFRAHKRIVAFSVNEGHFARFWSAHSCLWPCARCPARTARGKTGSLASRYPHSSAAAVRVLWSVSSSAPRLLMVFPVSVCMLPVTCVAPWSPAAPAWRRVPVPVLVSGLQSWQGCFSLVGLLGCLAHEKPLAVLLCPRLCCPSPPGSPRSPPHPVAGLLALGSLI